MGSTAVRETSDCRWVLLLAWGCVQVFFVLFYVIWCCEVFLCLLFTVGMHFVGGGLTASRLRLPVLGSGFVVTAKKRAFA